MVRKGLVSLVCIGVALLACSRAGAVVLRYNPKPGATFKYKESMKGAGEMTMPMSPEPMRMQMEERSLSSIKVLSVGPEAIQLEHTVLSGTLKLTMQGELAESEKLPKSRTMFKLTPRGKVLEARIVEGEKEAKAEEPFPGAMGFLQGMGQLSFVPFPEGDVKPGDKWSETVVIPAPAKDMPSFSASYNCELLELLTYRGRRCAKIRTSVDIPMPLTDWMAKLVGEESEAPVAAEGDGKISVSYIWYFDRENSVDVSSEGSGAVAMKMTMGDPESGMSFGVSQTMKMNFKSELVEK